jgi:hypothetical protein
METTPTTPPAEDDEAVFDTYVQQFGPTFTDEQGDRYAVVVTASNCDDDRCQRCYEPFMLSIKLTGGREPDEVLQLDLTNGWAQVDNLIAALTAARQRHRSTR